MGYIGGKAGAGVFHRIIGEMPPHSVYVEPFFGGGAVFRNKLRAAHSIIIDRDASTVAEFDGAAGVNAICGDALSILPTLALPEDAVVYCDPPYVLSARACPGRRYYKFEMEDADHERLLDVLTALKCRVMLSGYASKLYVDRLQKWRCCRFMAGTRGGPREESLWMNFPETEQLHDWRFAGLGHRQRLALRRQATRWLARLEGMPARQRGYLLAQIAASNPALAAAGVGFDAGRRRAASDLAGPSGSRNAGADVAS